MRPPVRGRGQGMVAGRAERSGAEGGEGGHGLRGPPPAGVIFICSSDTRRDCFKFRVMGMPLLQRDLVERITPGTMLFLFDTDLKEVYGLFEAASHGGMDLEPQAFRGSKVLYPAQVRFDIYRECFPLAEDVLRDAIRENYYSRFKFNFELTDKQVARLLKLLHPVGPPRRRPNGSHLPRRSLKELDHVRAPLGHSFEEDERQEHFHPHPSTERHLGYHHEGHRPPILHKDFHSPIEQDYPIPREDFYPPKGRGPTIRHEGLYPLSESLPAEVVSAPEGQGLHHSPEGLRPFMSHRDFCPSEGQFPPIDREDFNYSEVRDVPINNNYYPSKVHSHRYEGGHLPVPREVSYCPIPYEGHRPSFPDEHHPSIAAEDRYPPYEAHYLPSYKPDQYPSIHHESHYLATARNPVEDGARFSLSQETRHRHELDFVGPLPVHNTTTIGMINRGKQVDIPHLAQPHLSHGGDSFNPAYLMEPSKMEEIDRLAMKYVVNDYKFTGDKRAPFFPSTEPDASAGKQLVGGRDLPVISVATGRPPLRQGHLNQERNVAPAPIKRTGTTRLTPRARSNF